MIEVLYWTLMVGAAGFFVWLARYLVKNDNAAKTGKKPPGNRS